MGREGLDCFRRQLTERLNVLIREADTTINGMASGPENSGDPADQASADGDQNLLLRMRERERKLIEKIRESLERIEEGTYGFCEECGEEISEKRLMARPFTTLCMDCKTSLEEDERRRGVYLKVCPAKAESAGRGGVVGGYTRSWGSTVITESGIIVHCRKRSQHDRSHNPWREADRKAQCGKSARWV